MRRFYGVVGAMMLVLLPAYAAAQGDKPAAKTQTTKPHAAKAMTATGTVSAVSASSLTVKGKTEEMTFTVDDKTHVVESGASHKSAEMKGQNKPTVITDFVKVGDNVSVTYHDMDGTKHASSVRVRVTKSVK